MAAGRLCLIGRAWGELDGKSQVAILANVDYHPQRDVVRAGGKSDLWAVIESIDIMQFELIKTDRF